MKIEKLIVKIDGKRYLALDVELIELTDNQPSAEAKPRWNPVLFRSIGQVARISPYLIDRMRTAFSKVNITHVAHMLLITRRHDGYFILSAEGPNDEWCPVPENHPEAVLKRLDKFGDSTFSDTNTFLENLGVDLNIDLTNFPWDQLN